MASFDNQFGGNGGQHFRLFMEVYEESTNPGANQSTVRIIVKFRKVGSTAWWNMTTGGTQPSWSANVHGQGYGGNFNWPSGWPVGSEITLLNTTKVITHNADGSMSIGFSANADAKLGGDGGPTTASGSGSLALTHFPRYATINSFTVTGVTDQALQINVTTDVTCDSIQYSLNNGVSWTTINGDFTSKNIPLSGLPSDKAYQIKVQVRRKDSGLWTGSGTINATTLAQSKFLGFISV